MTREDIHIKWLGIPDAEPPKLPLSHPDHLQLSAIEFPPPLYPLVRLEVAILSIEAYEQWQPLVRVLQWLSVLQIRLVLLVLFCGMGMCRIILVFSNTSKSSFLQRQSKNNGSLQLLFNFLFFILF